MSKQTRFAGKHNDVFVVMDRCIETYPCIHMAKMAENGRFSEVSGDKILQMMTDAGVPESDIPDHFKIYENSTCCLFS